LKREVLEMINSVTDRGKHENRSCGDRESNSIILWENYGVQAIKRLMMIETRGKEITEKRSCEYKE
jgi:hypothetical protein